ncbi:MAG TPA: sugar ABC transporter ATP-binding protein [Actinomycetota bacterium]|nr:sugar ABC transporter ATP-binding protein [Actinomycetota bacterium]
MPPRHPAPPHLGTDVSQRPPLLEARGIAKRYGSVVALRSADLTVAAGEVHALLGANGAGKSTLVKILAGVIPADAGTVRVDGAQVALRSPAEAMRAGLATVFQDPALIPDLTVEHNLRLSGLEPERIRPWLARVGLAGLDLGAVVRELPLPVLRLLDLARALAHEPRLLMLDEITAALPADQAERVFSVMADWRAGGRSVLFITHRLAEVLRVCDRATVLRDGRHVATLVPGEGGESRLVEAMLGEVAAVTAGPARAREGRTEAPVALEARSLTSRGSLRGVSFRLHRGEVLGLVALEGQGQDRLFEVLSGARPYDGGELLVDGRPFRPRSPFDAIRHGVVLVPADRLQALLPQRPVRENLAAALYNRVARWFSLLRDEEDRVRRVVERLAIDVRAQRQARRLSGGNQQKLVVGRWLVGGFRVLLCFDPTRGIDIQTKEQIYGLLRELADEGAAVLYYTSELQEIPLICDRVLVMYGGTVVHEQEAATADEATLLNAAHGLQEAAV